MNIGAECGIDVEAMAERGVGPVTNKAEYEYKGQLKHGDCAEVTSTVTFHKRTRAIFDHTVRNADTGEVVCVVKTYGVWLEFATGKPYKLPEDILDRIRSGS